VPVTPPTPTPPIQVKISLTLPISLADFNASAQRAVAESLAVAAGLPRADAWRVALSFRAARRRLLAAGGGVAVDAVLSMPNAAAAGRAVASLTQAGINAQLRAAGLPDATVTSPAVVAGPLGGAGRGGVAGGAAASLLAAGLGAALLASPRL
jgi:hypothetical protein